MTIETPAQSTQESPSAGETFGVGMFIMVLLAVAGVYAFYANANYQYEHSPVAVSSMISQLVNKSTDSSLARPFDTEITAKSAETGEVSTGLPLDLVLANQATMNKLDSLDWRATKIDNSSFKIVNGDGACFTVELDLMTALDAGTSPGRPVVCSKQGTKALPDHTVILP